MGFNLDDYVDVAERIVKFYETFPDGRLTTVSWDIVATDAGQFVFCHARAYRTAEDELPGDGYAWEPFPGKTPYTKDSELMNAQTSSWGRAIVATGLLASKKIASKQEVEARRAEAQAGVPEPVRRPQNGSQGVPERYVDALRMAIRHKDANEWADDDEFARAVGAATTEKEKKELVASLEAGLLNLGGDPARVKARWAEVHGAKS